MNTRTRYSLDWTAPDLSDHEIWFGTLEEARIAKEKIPFGSSWQIFQEDVTEIEYGTLDHPPEAF